MPDHEPLALTLTVLLDITGGGDGEGWMEGWTQTCQGPRD